MKAFSCVNSRSLIVLALAFRSMIILSWFLFMLWDFAYFDINCVSSICLTDYPFFIELSWRICWMDTGVLKVSLVQTKLSSKLPEGASISHLGLSRVDKDLAGSGSKFSNLLQTNSVIVTYVYIVKRGEKERLAETLGFGGTDSLCFSFLFWWRFGTFTHCKTDGSFHVVHSWFTVLLTVSLQLLTILSFDLYSGVTKYYSETFGGGCLCCLSPALHKHRMLGLYSLSLLSEPLHRERWRLCTSWHSCSELVHTGEGPPAAFHGFLVRECIWGTRDASTQEAV